MSKGLKILIASLGSIGRRHLRVARALLPEAEIALLRRPETAAEPAPEGVSTVFGALEDALAFRPDLAILCSPAPMRMAQAEALLESGAHLLMEKPIAAEPAGLDRLLARIAAADRVVRVGYVLRFHPLLAAARARLRAGAIGAPRLARFEVGQYLPDWRQGDYRRDVSAQAALGGGALLELSHEIDLALWLLGAPDSVTASIGRVGRLEIDVEDYASVILDRGGLSVALHLDFLQRASRRRVMIAGDEATLELDLVAQTGVIRSGVGEDPLAAPRIGGDELYLRQFDAFCAEALQAYAPHWPEAAPGADPAEAAAVLDIVAAAKRAAFQGGRVPLIGRSARR